jgi:hypothetical protein
MRRKLILSMLLLTAATTTIGSNEAGATSVQVAAPGFNFSLNDYQPPPPNVYVYENAGRPYYVERDRRVYMQKKHHGHKKYKKHHRDNGRNHGHNKH